MFHHHLGIRVVPVFEGSFDDPEVVALADVDLVGDHQGGDADDLVVGKVYFL
jgi:hypothetical protein